MESTSSCSVRKIRNTVHLQELGSPCLGSFKEKSSHGWVYSFKHRKNGSIAAWNHTTNIPEVLVARNLSLVVNRAVLMSVSVSVLLVVKKTRNPSVFQKIIRRPFLNFSNRRKIKHTWTACMLISMNRPEENSSPSRGCTSQRVVTPYFLAQALLDRRFIRTRSCVKKHRA